MDGKRAVVWAAVSTEAQATRDRASLEEQLEAGREAAEREGHEVVRELVVPGRSRGIIDPAEAKQKIAAITTNIKPTSAPYSPATPRFGSSH